MDQFCKYKMFFYYVHFRGNAYKGMTIKAGLTNCIRANFAIREYNVQRCNASQSNNNDNNNNNIITSRNRGNDHA